MAVDHRRRRDVALAALKAKAFKQPPKGIRAALILIQLAALGSALRRELLLQLLQLDDEASSTPGDGLLPPPHP
jgi:hypothetical protein